MPRLRRVSFMMPRGNRCRRRRQRSEVLLGLQHKDLPRQVSHQGSPNATVSEPRSHCDDRRLCMGWVASLILVSVLFVGTREGEAKSQVLVVVFKLVLPWILVLMDVVWGSRQHHGKSQPAPGTTRATGRRGPSSYSSRSCWVQASGANLGLHVRLATQHAEDLCWTYCVVQRTEYRRAAMPRLAGGRPD